MTRIQPGIFETDQSPIQIHLEYGFHAMPVAERIGELIQVVRAECAKNDWDALFGFSRALWSAIAPDSVPVNLRSFVAIQGKRMEMPATQADLWVWLQGESSDAAADIVMAAGVSIDALGGQLRLTIDGYQRPENRDHFGFIDGTGNPDGEQARLAALIDEGEGGSFAFTQKWIHDLDKFDALSVSEQEKIIGRTKEDSIELEGEDMPETSHVSRTDAVANGVKQKILRRSVPYGSVGLNDVGLHFVAFACDLDRVLFLLERMTGLSDDGLHDRLTEYSRPVSGSFWYVPPLDALERIGASS